MTEFKLPRWFFLGTPEVPIVDDVEPMTKDEIIRRRTEGRLLHKYGERLLAVSFFGDFPCVLVGNPEQEVIVSVIE